MRKFIDARMDQKTLKPAHASFYQRLKLRCISRHNTAPKSYVHGALSFGSGKLLLKACECRRWRNTIERHVDHRRYTARGCGPCRGFITFPLGAARFVHVD